MTRRAMSPPEWLERHRQLGGRRGGLADLDLAGLRAFSVECMDLLRAAAVIIRGEIWEMGRLPPDRDPGFCDAGVPLRATGLVGALVLCNAPATGRHRYQCEHGHAVDRSTCDEHAPVDGLVGCRGCLLEHSRDVPMTFEPIPHSL